MRRLLLSMLTTLLVTGLLAGGALALFQDSETSSGNAFIAGTLDLKLSDANEGFGDGVTATWTMSNMAPGVTTVGPFPVNLQNSGSVAAHHVEIGFSHSMDEASNPVESDTNPNSTPGEMARWIEITSMTYNGSNFAVGYTDANSNGFFDLEDVTMSPYTDVGGLLDNLLPPFPDNVGSRSFTLELKLNSGATNDIQGDILTTTVTFTLNQDSSQ